MSGIARAGAPATSIEAPLVLLDLLAAHGVDAVDFARDVRRDNAWRGRFHTCTAEGTSVATDRLRSLPPMGINCLGGPARVDVELGSARVTCHGDGTAHVHLEGQTLPETIAMAWTGRHLGSVVDHPALRREDYIVLEAANSAHRRVIVARIAMPSGTLG